MAYTFVKRVGAPAGAINISIAGGTYLIDDVSNTIITESDVQKAANLASHPMLSPTGGTPGVYTPNRTGTSQELAYQEMTTPLTPSNTTAATSTMPHNITFTVAGRPVYVHLFSPDVYPSLQPQSINFGIMDGSNTMMGLVTISPQVAVGQCPVNVWRRFGTPGTYNIKAFAYSSSANVYTVQAGTGVGVAYAPCFLRAVEA